MRPGQDAALQWFCTLYLELFRILTIYLKPVLPALAVLVVPSAVVTAAVADRC